MALARFLTSGFILVYALAAPSARFPAAAEPVPAPTKDNPVHHYHSGQFEKMIRYYKKAIEEGDASAIVELAILYKDLGRYDKAIELFEKAYPSQENRLWLARLRYLNGQPAKASEIASPITEENSRNEDAWLLSALCALEEKKRGQAVDGFKTVLSLNKRNIRAHIELAKIYLEDGDLNGALEHFKKAKALDSSVLAVDRSLAEIYFARKNWEKALWLYGKLNRLYPDDSFFEEQLKTVKSKLGEDYFAEKRKQKALQDQYRPLTVTPFTPPKNQIDLRVAILEDIDEIRFAASRSFQMKTKKKTLLAQAPADEIYKLSGSSPGILIENSSDKNFSAEGPLFIHLKKPEGTVTFFNVPYGQGRYWSGNEHRSYRGSFEIRRTKKGFTVINQIGLEEYLYGVVPAEMLYRWPAEALKAQAVAARSEALFKRGRYKNKGYDLSADVKDQVYAGAGKETEATNAAVDATQGIIMMHNGKPIDAIYSSNSGGHTQDNIFWKRDEIPYLKGRLDASEAIDLRFPLSPKGLENWLRYPPLAIHSSPSKYVPASHFRWVRVYSAEEMNALVQKVKAIGDVRRILATERLVSGHIYSLRIEGSKENLDIKKEYNIRKALGGLRSSLFKVETKYDNEKNPEQFIFYGGGWGHGVGMCQSGASGMAQLGKTYDEILKHYFANTELEKLY